MITNSSMTHYHKILDTRTRLDKWVRTVYENVLWQGGKGASLNKGYVDSNDVKIRIPYSLNGNADISNFKIGDIVVKGRLTLNISTQSDLDSYDTYNITSIVDNNFGNLKHMHIEGK